MSDDAPICATCGEPLPRRPRPNGRARRYCSGRCRQAAYRAREVAGIPRGEPQAPPPPPGSSDAEVVSWLTNFTFTEMHPVKAAVEVVLMLRTIVDRTHRLSVVGESPPGLAWRHEATAAAVERILADYWTVDD